MRVETTNTELEDHLSPRPDSRDAAYLAWRDAKVIAAKSEARARPDALISHAKLRELFSL